MNDIQYIEAITNGNFLYWDMLGELRGMMNHKEDGLRWLSGGIEYNYYADTNDADGIVKRMKNGEIPKNLTFSSVDITINPAEPFLATGLFSSGTAHNMAHKLMDIVLPEPDKRLIILRVREMAYLKIASAIFNAAFQYDLFTYGHYIEMINNDDVFFYLAEYDGLPVGACMAQHGDNFVNISWVGTLAGYRKRGIAGYLIQAAEREGIRRGKIIGTLHGGADIAGAYRRIGYKEYSRGIDLYFTG